MKKWMFRKTAVLRGKSGDTLVEVMAGAMLLVMAAVMMSTGFLLVNRMIREGNLTRDAGQAAGSVVDGGDAKKNNVDVDSENGACGMTLNGKMLIFNGQYNYFSSQQKEGTGFTVFEPNAYISPRTMYQLMANMPAFWASLSLDQRKALLPAYATRADNDTYRTYLLTYTYQGTWPIFPPEKLPMNGTSIYGDGKPIYIQPYMYESKSKAWDGKEGLVIFGGTGMQSSWYTGLIYDYEFDTWYYTPKDSKSVNSFPNEDACMNYIRTSPNWHKLDEWNQTHPR